jgi:hypothetical protein
MGYSLYMATNNYRVDGLRTRTLADGTRVTVTMQIRWNRRHYSGDMGDTWTTDKAAAFATATARKQQQQEAR